jgi:CheY-like chemotaxis protein
MGLFGASKAKLLVIDDDPAQRAMIVSYLEDRFEVVEAENGEAALEAVGSGDFALILCDYEMPGMKGPEVVKSIRAIERLREVPIVMVTGRYSLDIVEEALGAGANDYVQKPIEFPKLIAKIDQLAPSA